MEGKAPPPFKRPTFPTWDRSTCPKPRQHFVYIKTHKTGSTTCVNIFQKYAYYHNLTALMAKATGYVSWPFPPAETDHIHAPGERYDVQFGHFRYNKTWLRAKFPTNTAYISLLREPVSHLKSCMNFYSLPDLLKITSANPVKTFLQDPWKYKNLSEVHFDYCDVIWDGTRNHLAFDLGYPTEGADDMEKAERYIKELEYDFTLVLLLEHLDESLVLLRRLMCWEMQDILYDKTPSNNADYAYKSYTPTAQELANLRRWKAVDYLLYDTFNKSLWRKIAIQGPDFYQELRYFKKLREDVNLYCHENHTLPNLTLTVEASKWSQQFVVDAKYCWALKKDSVIPKIKPMSSVSKQEAKRWKIVRPASNLRAIINGQPTFKYEIELRSYENKMRTKTKPLKRTNRNRMPTKEGRGNKN
ncbi:galactosylceramide sulfotransferase-like [Branchiostoma floridae]|uniref:Galactosylceramide sulfotransferase-like n=1 Tax=Branchiostoma floridae TaxID=7739 RepID=A0A9J7HLD2_BRAFL|nr:galactosylceramide sulfotransferase-like [Branchiostoma floridae]